MHYVRNKGKGSGFTVRTVIKNSRCHDNHAKTSAKNSSFGFGGRLRSKTAATS